MHRCVTAGGEVRWYSTAARLVEAAPVALLEGVSVDVTAPRKAREAIASQLAFAQTLTGSLAEGLVAVNLEGRITFINPSAEELLRCAGRPVIGARLVATLDLRQPDGSRFSNDEHPLARAMFTRAPCHADDCSIRLGDARSFPVTYSASPLVVGGRVGGAVLLFQDIEGVRRAERYQRLLAEASGILTESLDYRGTLEAVGRLVVPLLADVCIFDELDEHGDVDRLTVAGSEADRRRLAHLAPGAAQPRLEDPARAGAGVG